VVTGVVAGVEIRVESMAAEPASATLQLRLLGPMTLLREGVPIALPGSRKVRALIAYLALAHRPHTRAHLCELFGDVPNDPRGELRWCLSKARAVLDDAGHRRIVSASETVTLDLADMRVDASEIERALHDGIAGLDAERLRALADRFAGEFLEGLEIERSPTFAGCTPPTGCASRPSRGRARWRR